MSSYAHVHDDAMRPNGSDLLKGDRPKAGGIKPGTWALKPMCVRLRQVFGFRSCLSCGPKGRVVTKTRSAELGFTRRFEAKLRYQSVVKVRRRTEATRRPLPSATIGHIGNIWSRSNAVSPRRGLCVVGERGCIAGRM